MIKSYNCWVSKDAVLEHTHSQKIGYWLRNYNVWIPCCVPIPESTDGSNRVLARIAVAEWNNYEFDALVPIDSVMFDHPLLRHSMPLKAWPQFHEFLRVAKHGRQSWSQWSQRKRIPRILQ